MKLSVLVPVHNESPNIRPFAERAARVLDSLKGLGSWEIVFINDGSEDDSLPQVLALRAQDPRLKVVTLSRNFGYHAALVAGLSSADADLYAIVDVDGEDPPELLAQFHEAVQGGAQVAYGIRSKRDEPALITWLRALFYHINRRIADSPTVLWMAEFSMITRQVRDAILAPRTTFPFLRAEIAHVGFKRVGIPYRRAKRVRGESHYNIYSMTKFAVGGFLASSTFPLRLILYVAALLAAALPAAAWLFGLSGGQIVVLASLCSFYFILLSVPIIALYLARTYKNGVARPVFLIDQTQTRL